MDIEQIVIKTVENFYNLNEKQRVFITALANDNKADYNRIELIKALMLFNYAHDNEFPFGDSRVEQFISEMDSKSVQLNKLISTQDEVYRNNASKKPSSD